MSTIEEVRAAEKKLQEILEAVKKAGAQDPDHLSAEFKKASDDYASLFNSPELRFVCEDVRSGVDEGQGRPGHEVVRDRSAWRPEGEDFEHGSAGTAGGR
jgi:hypothetical protein